MGGGINMAEINWKTIEQLEKENKEREPTEKERLEALENAMLEIILGGMAEW